MSTSGAGRHRVILRPLIESALEAGLSHSDAVRLAIAVYKEIDLLARGASLTQLPTATLREIRLYARAILRSGSTFSSFEIAQRAVATYRLTQDEIRKLDAEWRTETASKRLRRLRPIHVPLQPALDYVGGPEPFDLELLTPKLPTPDADDLQRRDWEIEEDQSAPGDGLKGPCDWFLKGGVSGGR